jgi:hypothetical protein
MTPSCEFPSLPHWLTSGRERQAPRDMRPFGGAVEDLSVVFRLARRPEIITRLLSLCCRAADGPVDDRLWLDIPIGMRIEALLALATLSDAGPFAWRTRCESPSCAEGDDNAFELGIDQILSVATNERGLETLTIAIGEVQALVRRPTGLDQTEWLQRDEAGAEPMLRAILVRPTLDELQARGLTVDAIDAAVDEAMDSFDPILSFRVKVVCPRCGAAKDMWPDLAGAALERLAGAQRKAIESVHRLALRYHWTESEIFVLPEWRRQTYLSLLESEGL